ncbi:MAG: hypothetical protein AB8H79_21550 [Myxococcota bacterium]
MANAYIPREPIHAWVEDIDTNKAAHKPALKLLLSKQRPLSRYVHDGVSAIGLERKSTVMFIAGVLLRVFDLAGGKVKKVSADDLREAEGIVTAWVPQVVPPDEGFSGRVRAVEGRAQPHLLDECLVDLFDNPELTSVESAKLFFLVWIAVEALDRAWTPGSGFEGETTYAHAPTADELADGQDADGLE